MCGRAAIRSIEENVRVNDEHQQIGTLNSDFNLMFDFFIEFIDVVNPDNLMLVGTLQADVLPVRLASRTCQIPVTDIVEVHVPTPTISDTLRKRINKAIRDLGHAEWKKRERATNDPEIRRRCESILSEIDE